MILSYKLGYSCACNLRDAIKERTGKILKVTCYPERVKELHVRYGNSSSVSCSDTVYNSPEFIRLCSNKKSFSDLLISKGFTNVPRFSRETPEASDFPLVIRQTLTGFSGVGIVLCMNMDDFSREWKSNYWWTRFVKTRTEYRLQVLGGQIGRVFKKISRETEPEYPIRNSYSDYHYSLRNNTEHFSKMQDLVTKLSEYLDGKYYALDLGLRSDGGGYFVYEANSGYGMNTNSALALADYLVKEGVI